MGGYGKIGSGNIILKIDQIENLKVNVATADLFLEFYYSVLKSISVVYQNISKDVQISTDKREQLLSTFQIFF